MSLKRAVLDVLEDAPQGLCDACLRRILGASSHQHVNAVCRKLVEEGRLVRESGASKDCNSCGRELILNRLLPAVGAQPSVASNGVVDRMFGINQLDDLRRQIIQFLNGLDPGGCREGFSKRVGALRNSQMLPTTIASLMLTHATYRNEMYYSSYQPTKEESKMLEEIDKQLRGYLANNVLPKS